MCSKTISIAITIGYFLSCGDSATRNHERDFWKRYPTAQMYYPWRPMITATKDELEKLCLKSTSIVHPGSRKEAKIKKSLRRYGKLKSASLGGLRTFQADILKCNVVFINDMDGHLSTNFYLVDGLEAGAMFRLVKIKEFFHLDGVVWEVLETKNRVQRPSKKYFDDITVLRRTFGK